MVGDVVVTNGLFTVLVNDRGFGAGAANGDERWLQVEVCGALRCFAAGPWRVSGTTLSCGGGNVGIGTSTPEKKLTLAGDIELDIDSAHCRRLRLGCGDSSGFLYARVQQQQCKQDRQSFVRDPLPSRSRYGSTPRFRETNRSPLSPS